MSFRRDGDDVLRRGRPHQDPALRENLTVYAGLAPVAIISTFAGIWLVRRVPTDRFYAIILLITFAIGANLTYDAVQALFLA
jgi:uncharacterized protein